ncbi:phytosulfokine receptor 1-like [Rutidosis leptorrhynchoides]|uniref:phytosulfokine receptor 1-like n=1 Tax=Rutidosis leptorrhynchoides TaxID=125765 RepID=UPI003A999E0F
MTGAIPDSLGQLKNLKICTAFGNRLSGIVPPLIFNISSITAFDVGVNELHGRLPVGIGTTLPNLQFFSVGYNQFTGSIPLTICNLSSAELLQFSVSQFSGNVPFVGNLKHLLSFRFSADNLGSRGLKDDLISLLFD